MSCSAQRYANEALETFFMARSNGAVRLSARVPCGAVLARRRWVSRVVAPVTAIGVRPVCRQVQAQQSGDGSPPFDGHVETPPLPYR